MPKIKPLSRPPQSSATRLCAAFALLLALTTSGCYFFMNKEPNIQHNPHPRLRYELTLTIQDAPGPFESVTGYMQYEVANEKCSPENPISGTWDQPRTNVPFTFTRTGDNTYTGAVYLDLLRDEDYYGLGMCRWKMVAAIVSMKAGEVSFSPDIDADQIALQQVETLYFAKETYGQMALKNLSSGGVRWSDWIAQQPEKFFSTTLTAKESFQ